MIAARLSSCSTVTLLCIKRCADALCSHGQILRLKTLSRSVFGCKAELCRTLLLQTADVQLSLGCIRRGWGDQLLVSVLLVWELLLLLFQVSSMQ